MKNILIAILLGILFLIFSHPLAYQASDKLFSAVKIRTSFDNVAGLSTFYGQLIHTFLFTLVVIFILHIKLDKNLVLNKKINFERPSESIEI